MFIKESYPHKNEMVHIEICLSPWILHLIPSKNHFAYYNHQIYDFAHLGILYPLQYTTKPFLSTSWHHNIKTTERKPKLKHVITLWNSQGRLKSTRNSNLNTGSFPRNHIWMCGVLKKSTFAYQKFHIYIPNSNSWILEWI